VIQALDSYFTEENTETPRSGDSSKVTQTGWTDAWERC